MLTSLFISGCATPVGVNVMSPRDAYNDTYANPLGAGVASESAKTVLHRYDLLQKFSDDPGETIAMLHAKALLDDRRDILYALAETSYLYAGELEGSSSDEKRRLARDYYLLSSIYSHMFFLDNRSGPAPTVFDHRARTALDMYRYGLWQGLLTGTDGAFVLEEKIRTLPLGKITLKLDTSNIPWPLTDFDTIEPADKFKVRGISVRNRTPGLGLPLIAVKKETEENLGQGIPLTVFMRVQGDMAALNTGSAVATLEVYSSKDSSSIEVNNRQAPLETDLTAPLAYRLEGSEVWGSIISSFLGKELKKLPNGLYQVGPYQPGKVPVVFVHGTASSPVWWSEMFNTLTFDPVLRQKYQFWFYVYTSSKPLVESAASLRDDLRKRVASLDPKGKDPALQEMVVVGHSQGGLLTKMLTVDSGNKLLRAITTVDIEDMKIPAENKTSLSRLIIFKPLPFVKRVVFMSTPHRGSYRSKSWNRGLVRMLVSIPSSLIHSGQDLFEYYNDDTKRLLGGKPTLLTSADGMSPENPLLPVLAALPLAPWIKGHSIIAVNTSGDIKEGNDGVVEYTSAHLEGVESEFVVNSDHSSQLNPIAIDEVRRILMEHIHVPSLIKEVAEQQKEKEGS
jgi:pimeloyl-ACP methyl ester carboxylesterase